MHGFRDNEVLLLAGYDVIAISSPGAPHTILHDGFWKTDHDFLIAFHSNFLSGMHGFQENEVLLQAGYDVIVISPLGVAHAILHNGFWKSDHEFLIAFHSKFVSVMHGFRDNEVLLQAGYDVIVISPPGGRFTLFYMTDSERATMTS